MTSKKGLLRYKEPRTVGPGIWYSIHMLVENAVKSRDPNDFNLAYKYIITIKENFPCLKCKRHIDEFWDNNSPESYKARYHEGKMVEEPKYEFLSVWAYDLHVSANKHTKSKGNVPYDDVIDFFRSNEACTDDDCNGDEEEEEESTDFRPPPMSGAPTLSLGNGALRS
jgi:hypothetical protein